MNVFWFAVGALIVFAALIVVAILGYRAADERGHDGYAACALVVGLLACVGVLVLGSALLIVGVGRPIDRANCEKRSALSDSEYVWVDFNYFTYECLPVSGSGDVADSRIIVDQAES